MNDNLKRRLVDAIASGNTKVVKEVLKELKAKHNISVYHYVDGEKVILNSNDVECIKTDIEIEIITDRSQVDWSLSEQL